VLKWVESGGRRYRVMVALDYTVLRAEVEVTAHDKRPTLRRIRHPVTIARLQDMVRPAAKCPTCGGVPCLG